MTRGKWIGLTQAADEIAGMITAEESTGASRETLLALAHAERSLRDEAEDMLRRLREMEHAA